MVAAAASLALLIATPKFTEPPKQPLLVAFIISENANLMDVAGAWEVFQDTMLPKKGLSGSDMVMPFQLYTVAETRTPIHMGGGMLVTPDYTFDNAPAPSIVVIGAQSGKPRKMVDWLRARTRSSEVVMSVCTGAFKLALTGVLEGKKATTHHEFFDDFQKANPGVLLQRGQRYVQSDAKVFTAGGLTSGIDLALHVVELYFGREVAVQTAKYMEYEGTRWLQDAG
jgi:transcriptional regulator GlxA family with amidase domain